MRSLTTMCCASAAALFMTACAVDLDEPGATATAQHELGDPVLDALSALPGVTVTELEPVEDARQFLLLVTQPVDHFRAHGPTFQERVLLRHRGFGVPTTLATTGYGLFSPVPRDNEISFLFGGNALILEHRFFEESTPSPADTRFLNIRQAAADHHHVVELLKPLYTGAWISTGASKGGMTSIYHRRYYPRDVDATVAYVAPQSYTTNDPRYGAFLERVGSPACRQRIVDFQRALLDRRDEVQPLFETQAADNGLTYNTVGGLDFAYEHSVQEFRFAMWQFLDEDFCAFLPGAGDPADFLSLFLDFVSGPASLASDQSLEEFGSYYFQAATQLGSYGPLERHIGDLLDHRGTYRVERYSTFPITRVDPISVPEVQLWLATQGERIMLVNGQNDPWSENSFQLGFARDSYRFVVPAGNHGASISQLPDADFTRALSILSRWAGVPALTASEARARKPSAAASSLGAPGSLDDGSFDRQPYRLPGLTAPRAR